MPQTPFLPLPLPLPLPTSTLVSGALVKLLSVKS